MLWCFYRFWDWIEPSFLGAVSKRSSLKMVFVHVFSSALSRSYHGSYVAIQTGQVRSGIRVTPCINYLSHWFLFPAPPVQATRTSLKESSNFSSFSTWVSQVSNNRGKMGERHKFSGASTGAVRNFRTTLYLFRRCNVALHGMLFMKVLIISISRPAFSA